MPLTRPDPRDPFAPKHGQADPLMCCQGCGWHQHLVQTQLSPVVAFWMKCCKCATETLVRVRALDA